MALPSTGDPNWGVPLNDYILNTVQLIAQTAFDNGNTHAAASDPHGDRAFSAAALAAVTATFDAASGRAGLGVDGRLKPAQAPAGGGLGNTYDLVKDFGAVNDGVTNSSAMFQAAADTATAAGGGELWVPDGTYIIHTTVNLGANTHLHLSDGAIVKRSSTSTAFYMFTNFTSGSTATVYTGPGNITVSGGTIDGGGVANAQPVTALGFMHGFGFTVSNVNFLNMVDYSAIALIAAKSVRIRDCKFLGLRIVGVNGWQARAVRCAFANSSTEAIGGTLPSGALDNTACSEIWVTGCTMDKLGSFSSYGSIFMANSASTLANAFHTRIWVQDNIVNFSNDYGVMLPVSVNNQIHRNYFGNCNGGVWGNLPSNYTAGGSYNEHNITDNQFVNAGVINDSPSIRGSVIIIAGLYVGASPLLINVWGHGARIANNQILNWANTGQAIGVFNILDSMVTGNKIYNGTGSVADAINMNQCGATIVSGNFIRTATSTGITLRSQNSSFPNNGCWNSVVSGNFVDITASVGIQLTDSVSCTVTGNRVDHSTTNSIRFSNSGSGIADANRVDNSVSGSASGTNL